MFVYANMRFFLPIAEVVASACKNYYMYVMSEEWKSWLDTFIGHKRKRIKDILRLFRT